MTSDAEKNDAAERIEGAANQRPPLRDLGRDAFRTLIENAHDGFLIADGEGRHLFANRRAAEITGRTVEELLATPMPDLAHPDERSVLVERLRKRLQGEDAPAQYETRIVAKNGDPVCVEVTGARAEWQGRPVTVVVLRDVTSRRRLEQSLHEAEARFQLMFEQSPLGSALVALDGSFVRVNQAFCRLFGYAEEELLTRNFMEVTRASRVKADTEGARRLLAGEIEHYVTDRRYLRKDGEVVWGHLSVSLVRDAAGRPLYFLPLVEDVTEPKRAEALLRRTEARYRHIFENSLLGIYQSTPDGAYLSMNRAFANMAGYDSPEQMMEAVANVQHQVYVRPEDRARLKDALSNFGIVRGFETELYRQDGSRFWIVLNARAVRDPKTGKVFHEGTTIDISERKRAEDELRKHRAHLEEVVARRTAALADRNDRLKAEIEARSRMERELVDTKEAAEAANRAKSAFLAAMSHEFRTPLNAIIGFSEVLSGRRFGPLNDKQADFVGRILTGGRHLLQMISDVLDISQIEAGKMILEPGEADVGALLREAAAMVAGQAEIGGLELAVETAPALEGVRVSLDARRFRQIMLNLLSNAIKYTPRGGRVTIRGWMSEDRLAVTVIDTGLGIETKDQKRVFGEFERVDVAKEKRRPGVGLGLSLTRKLVELQGGAISVVSEGHLKGSAFTFVLPVKALGDGVYLAAGAAPAGAPWALEPPPLRGEGKRVLVVEDDTVSRRLVVVLLKDRGCTVLEAATGQEGYDTALAERPDLILMDVGLPDMSGLEVVRRLRQADPPVRTPVVALTAYAMKGDRETCLEAGCDDYLSKPVNTAALIKMVAGFLEEKPAAEA